MLNLVKIVKRLIPVSPGTIEGSVRSTGRDSNLDITKFMVYDDHKFYRFSTSGDPKHVQGHVVVKSSRNFFRRAYNPFKHHAAFYLGYTENIIYNNSH